MKPIKFSFIMFIDIKMNTLYMISIALGFMALASGLPMPQSQALVPGVFIPADAFKNLQDRANANDRSNSPQQPSNQGFQPNTIPQNNPIIGNPGYQPNTSPQNNQPTGNTGYLQVTSPQNNQPIGNSGYQPNTNVQNSQPIGSQGYQPNANIQNSQPITNQGYQPNANVQISQPPSNQGYQPNGNVQTSQPISNQVYPQNINAQNPQPYSNQGYQPGINIQNQQPQYQPVVTYRTLPEVNQMGTNPLIVDRISGTNSNQLTMLPMNQPNVLPNNQPTIFPLNQQAQPGQAIVYVQQQQPNQQTIFVPQSNQLVQQPLVFTQSPNQGFGVQNGQVGQPTKVVFTNALFGNQNQDQNSNSVYTLIPLNGQNSNSNTGSYLIPIQSGASSMLISSGK